MTAPSLIHAVSAAHDAGLLEETLEDTGTHITGTTLAGDAVRIPYRMHGGTVSTEINPKAVLDLPMQENDARAKTIRQYLAKLAESVWLNDEGFDGITCPCGDTTASGGPRNLTCRCGDTTPVATQDRIRTAATAFTGHRPALGVAKPNCVAQPLVEEALVALLGWYAEQDKWPEVVLGLVEAIEEHR